MSSPAPVVTAALLHPFAYSEGYQERVVGATPAAGANFAQTVEGRYTARLLSVECLLTTSAVVANRSVQLRFTDSDGVIWSRDGAGVFVTASDAITFCWSVDRTVSDFASTGSDRTAIFCGLSDRFLLASDAVRIVVANIDATDTLTAIRLWFERYPTGPRGYPLGRVPE